MSHDEPPDPNTPVILRDDDPLSPTCGTDIPTTQAEIDSINEMLGHLVAGRMLRD